MNTNPENARASLGTGLPWSSATSFHAIERRSRTVAKYPGPSLRALVTMATGFIGRHCIVILAALTAIAASAAEVSVVGVVGDKAAVLVIDGAEPRTVRVGQKFNGVAVIAVTGHGATLEFDGKRRVLPLGPHVRGPGTAAASGAATVKLAADTRGHFVVEGQINGGAVRMLVDTGATLVSLPNAEARRLGIDYTKGERGHSKTANGVATVYRVRLDTVRVGDIELHNVDALVHEGAGLDIALLGMSFLARVEMRREAEILTLTKRF